MGLALFIISNPESERRMGVSESILFDLQWIAMPTMAEDASVFHPFDLGALLCFLGLWFVVFGRMVSKHPALPVNDPRLEQSLRFKLRI